MLSSYFIIEKDFDTVNNIQMVFEKFPEFTCLGISDDHEEGMNSILKQIPDIIFINIDITPNIDCTDVFAYCQEINDHIPKKPIFIALSVDEKKAYKTIKNRFYDYILKPGRQLEIRKTILQLLKRQILFLDNVICL